MPPNVQNRVQSASTPIICSPCFSRCLPCHMLWFPLFKWILHQDPLFDQNGFDYALSRFFKSQDVLLLGILQCLKNWKGARGSRKPGALPVSPQRSLRACWSCACPPGAHTSTHTKDRVLFFVSISYRKQCLSSHIIDPLLSGEHFSVSVNGLFLMLKEVSRCFYLVYFFSPA